MKYCVNGIAIVFYICIIQLFFVTLQPETHETSPCSQDDESMGLSNSKEELLGFYAFHRASKLMIVTNRHHISAPLSGRKTPRKGEM